MKRLSLTLLGGFQARLDANRALALSVKKAQALLAYLAIPLGQFHSRDKLAALLWGEMREPQARDGLRHALLAIRKATGDATPLRNEGDALGLDPALVEADVEDFERCVAEGGPAALEQAAALYRGELLEGLALAEPSFEEWLVAQRVRLRELALDALARLLVRQRDERALESAIQTGLRVLALDPLQEAVHRTLMRLYAEMGRREAALRQYQVCVGALHRELRAEPEEETKTLYREILRRRLARAPKGAPSSAGAPDHAPAIDRDPPSRPPSDSPLVGRERELRHLRDALQTAWAGQARLVAVTGEAGIGKSRLTTALAAEAARNGGRTLLGHCYETEHVLPFGPWIDALRAARLTEEGDVGSSLPAVWLAELARLLPDIGAAPPSGSPSDRGQLFEAIAQLLERSATVRPLLLILEDVHWADEMSLRLLAFVGRRLAPSRVLVVVTAREEDLADSATLRHTLDELAQDNHLVRMALSPLSRPETEALALTLMVPSEVAHIETRLWRASEGNPFMVLETVRALRGGSTAETAAGLPLPERVRRLIASRIERLGERSRGLVALAAVIGRPFGFALLERAADLGEAETAEAVEELVRHRVLHGSGEGFEFTHDRIREVVYGQLLPPRRALLHRRIAEMLETLHTAELGSHALVLGTHYREGGVWAKAVSYLAQAGTDALLRYAARDAVTIYEQALAALVHLPESRETGEQRTEIRFNLGYALFSAGEFEAASARFREAERLALALGDTRRLGQIHAAMNHVLASAGDFAGAAQAGLRALTIATSLGDAAIQMWTSVGLGRVYFIQGDYRRAIACTREVIDALAHVPLDERFLRINILPAVACRTWLALSLGRIGKFDEALAWSGEAARIAEELNGQRERVWAGQALAFLHLARGDAEEATAVLEPIVTACREGRFPIYTPFVTASLGAAYAMSGRGDAALSLVEEGVAGAGAIKQMFGYPTILIQAAAAHLEAGRLAEAERHASTALELTRRHGGRGDEAVTLHLLGEIAERTDGTAPEAALDRYVEALALAEALGMAPLRARCHLSLGVLHHRAGRVADARSELSRAVEMLGQMRMRYWLGPAETLLAACA